MLSKTLQSRCEPENAVWSQSPDTPKVESIFKAQPPPIMQFYPYRSDKLLMPKSKEFKKRHWFFAVFIPLLISWGIDRLTKEWAQDLTTMILFEPVGFVQHHNHGAMLGLFSHLPSLLRVVSLATGGAFIFFSYLILQYLLPTRSLILRGGLSFLMGGILGNVTDRIIYGYVVDFIFFKVGSAYSPVFNFADAIQWVGFGMIAHAILKEGKNLFPENDLRKSYLINAKFQLAYCFKLMGLVLGFGLITLTYSYTFFRVYFSESVPGAPISQTNLDTLQAFVLSFVAVSVCFSMIAFWVGLILSNRAAGPLYAFERFLEDLITGKKRNLKLRAGDEFKHLEELAEKLSRNLNDKELPPTG